MLLSISNLFAQDPIVIHLQAGTYTSDVGMDGSLYLADIPGILVSRNQGITWQTYYRGVICENLLMGEDAQYASGMDYFDFTAKIIRSKNQGASWDTLFSSRLANSKCSKIAISGNKMVSIYKVPGKKDEVLFSKDAGTTWNSLAIPDDDRFPFSDLRDIYFLDSKLVITDADGILTYDSTWEWISTGMKNISAYVQGNALMVAGCKDNRAAICIFKDGLIDIEEFGEEGSQAYSVASANGKLYAVVRSQNGSLLQYKVRGQWNTIAQYPFQLKSCKVVGNKLYVHGPQNLVIYEISAASGINQGQGQGLPEKFTLEQNYPNPFNPTTNIGFQVKKNTFVTLKVYDGLGKEVTTLVDAYKSLGFYSVEFNATNLPSGIYYYVIKADGISDVKKMMLVK